MLDLDITSLLDILVILLVFLLKSFNSSSLVVDMNEKIELPNSKSRSYGSHAVQIQVTKSGAIWMDSKKLGRIPTGTSEIGFLREKLEEKKQQFKDQNLKLDNSEMINIVMDQSIKYEMMNQVMNTAALSGFPKFKFIVQGNY